MILHSDLSLCSEDTVRGDTLVEIPKTSSKDYVLLDVDASGGAVSLMTEDGATKDDVNLARDEHGSYNSVSEDVIERFGGGEDLKVVVFKAFGQEIVTQVYINVDGA